MTVVRKDRVNEVIEAVRALGAQDVKVGFPESTSSRDDDAINNPALAYIHEYGAPEAGVPERPFLVVGVEGSLGKITDVMKAGARAALKGNNLAGQTLNRVGLIAQGSVQQKIVDGPFIPNLPETIRRKGSDRPLIDTGALRQAVSYVVEDKD